MREEIKLGNLFTLLNLASGFGCILASITENFRLAMVLLVISLICDLFDGRMARRAGKATAFGTEVDSLSDMISFGLAPAIFGFMHLSTKIAVVAYLINISAAAFRLARYNVLHKLHYFIGMPITWNAVIILILAVLKIPYVYWPAAYIFSAVLMASPFKIKKV
ncbi:CDP-alcohol phosphatidyltransferase family protein [Candidatus Woesearchaeota archaeon]|nr:CDP-alcohol phosphatidyltransferase family protein [Candidatus Woesearchaeota archaeon]MBW3016090.1 CDP-alcohol phosphatidyltransferase family protein [Candidatus Woesearchaeota archaeon]